MVASLWPAKRGDFAQRQACSCLLAGSAAVDLAQPVANASCRCLAAYIRSGVFRGAAVLGFGTRRRVFPEMAARTGGVFLRQDVLLCLPDPSLGGISGFRGARYRANCQDIFRNCGDSCVCRGDVRPLCVELSLSGKASDRIRASSLSFLKLPISHSACPGHALAAIEASRFLCGSIQCRRPRQ